MFLFSDQFTSSTKANLDTPLTIISALTSKTFEGLEEIIELNMSIVRTSLTDTLSSTKELLSAKGPQEFFTLSTTLIQPNIEKFLAYGRQLSSISASTQAEFIKAAVATPAVEEPVAKAAVATPAVEAPVAKAAVATPAVEAPVAKAAVTTPAVEAPVAKAAVTTPAVEAPAVKAAVTAPVVEAPVVKAAVAAPAVEAPVAKAAVAAPVVEAPVAKAAVAAFNKKKPGRLKK